MSPRCNYMPDSIAKEHEPCQPLAFILFERAVAVNQTVIQESQKDLGDGIRKDPARGAEGWLRFGRREN